jgi:hypothetical protein
MDFTLFGIILVLSTVAVDYFMFAVVAPRIIKRAFDKNAEKYNPKSGEGLNIDVSYNQSVGGILTELIGLHLRGYNIGSIIETAKKMFFGGKPSSELTYKKVEEILKDNKLDISEKLKRIIELTR